MSDVQVGRIEVVDPRFERYVRAGEQVEVLASGFRWLEGLLWMGDWGTLLFQDVRSDATMQWCEHDGVAVWRSPSQHGNGQARDREGRVVICRHLTRDVVRVEHDGSLTVLADRFGCRRFNSPNDVAVRSDGSVWFTDPLYGITFPEEGEPATSELEPGVYRLDPASGTLDLVLEGYEGPNGIAFSPDERRLYVAETGAPHDPDPALGLWVYDVDDGGRTLSRGRELPRVSPGFVDGMAVGEDGALWVSAGDGVQCLTADGELLGRIRLDTTVANLTFGGARRDRLFIGAGDTLYALRLDTRGARWP